MTRTRSAIAATGLRKSFGEHLVLDGIDVDVAEGTIFALLGPNGRGSRTSAAFQVRERDRAGNVGPVTQDSYTMPSGPSGG